MSTEVYIALIGTIGTISGVIAGVALTGRSQAAAAARERSDHRRAERLALYSDFLAAARDWRAAVLNPSVQIVESSTMSPAPHADGGRGAERTMALRVNIALVAETRTIIGAARMLIEALSNLAEAMPRYTNGKVPKELLDGFRARELDFVRAAREELGSAKLADDDLRHLYTATTRTTT